MSRMSLDEDLCGTRRVDLERQNKEKTMGRPINKKYLGQGEDKILVSRYYFTGASEVAGATTPAWIVSQRSTNKFSVTDGSTTETLTLVNEADGALSAGEMTIHARLDDSSTVQVTKLRNRTIQYEGGTANVANIQWEMTGDNEGDGIAELDAQ
jgi:hypothetical protein